MQLISQESQENVECQMLNVHWSIGQLVNWTFNQLVGANKTNSPVLVAVVEPCVQRDEGAADDVCGDDGDGGGGLLVLVAVAVAEDGGGQLLVLRIMLMSSGFWQSAKK